MADNETDPTRRFAQHVDDQIETGLQDSPDTDPTRIAPTSPHEQDPNALAPNRLRYVLVCLLFALISVWLVINNYHLFSQTAGVGIAAAWTGGVHYVNDMRPELEGTVNVGDEVVSVDGHPVNARYRFRQIVREFKPGEVHSFQLKRAGVPYEIELQAKPVTLDYTLNNISNGLW